MEVSPEGGGDVTVDANEEVKLLCKFQNNFFIYFFFLGGGGSGWGGQGGYEWRSEAFVKIQTTELK